MTPSDINWTPAIAVLAIGAVVGLFLLWRLRVAPPPPARASIPNDAEVRDLEVRRDALITQLRELDELATKLAPADLASERQRLELEAARVLMELDRRSAERRATSGRSERARATAPPAAGSTLRGFLWGVGSLGALVVLLFLAWHSGGTRPDAAPAAAQPEVGVGAPANAQVAALRAQIAKDPEDLAARLELARHALAANDMMSVFAETRFVLERSPNEPRALTYQAVVRLAMGQPEKAEEMLERAIASRPDLEDAHIYLMLVHTEAGDVRAAERALARAAKQFPSEKEALESTLARMRREVSSAAAPLRDPAANPHAALDSAEASARSPEQPPAAPAAASDAAVAGMISLAPAAKAPSSARAAIYVLLRPAGQPSGPPLAVKKLPAQAFPVPFEIGTADSMTGAAIPARVELEARLDEDGDAATRSPGEPRAVADGIARGARDVRLTLTPQR